MIKRLLLAIFIFLNLPLYSKTEYSVKCTCNNTKYSRDFTSTKNWDEACQSCNDYCKNNGQVKNCEHKKSWWQRIFG